MCPFAVASDFGRNFMTSCLVSPGHMERELFSIAVINVNVNGLHNVRWRKVLRSVFDFVQVLKGPCTELIYCRVFRA